MTDITLTENLQVELVHNSGSDATVVMAARASVSYNFDAEPEALPGLIGYLIKNRHSSPFEHSSLTFIVDAPIFVAREWMRHRTWSYNEVSGRYSKLAPVFYLPGNDRPLVNEGSGAHPSLAPGDEPQGVRSRYQHYVAYRGAWDAYEAMLAAGVATEVARNVLPVGVYTRFMATANLLNVLKFLSLRTHNAAAATISHPQWEIDKLARQVEDIVAEKYPIVHQKWNENGRSF